MMRPAAVLVVLATALTTLPAPGWAQATGPGNQGGGGNNNAGGILIDADGVLLPEQVVPGLSARRRPGKGDSAAGDVCVSLRRLAEVLAVTDPDELPPEAYVLGGLTRIDQVVVDADSRDVLLIGPGQSPASGDGPVFEGEATGRPLMRTGDFLTMIAAARGPRFTVRCSIDPEPERLKAYQDRIRATASSVNFGNAAAWYEGLAKILGRQVVTVGGVPETSRVSNVLAAADYSMKRIALGLEPSGVKEIRGQLAYAGGETGSAMKRWWFAPLYDDLRVDAERTVFELSGPRVRLLAQQELILDNGQRVNADRSQPSTEAFARQFTAHFEELTAARPIFADLKNQFDLAVVAALLRRETLFERQGIAWEVSPEVQARLSPACRTPRFVESGANIRRVNRGTIVGVVGGVEISPAEVLGREQRTPASARSGARPATSPDGKSQFSWRIAPP